MAAPTGDMDRSSLRRAAAATDIAGIVIIVLLGGAWAWWALEFGAYFGAVLYPGVALLAFGTIVLVATAPWRADLSLSVPVRVAMWSLVGLAGWSLLSAVWSPTPDLAVEDAQRMLAYAIAFGLGLWSCSLLGRRMELAMLPLVGAALIAGLVTVVGLASGDGPTPYLEIDGTLQYPLGYRNANVAFFLIAFWPCLCVAGSPRVSGLLRVGAAMTATLCIQMAALGQSRGAVLGLAVALVVYVVAAPERLRAVFWLLLGAAPALVCVPAAMELFDAGKSEADTGALVTAMNGAGLACLAGLILSGAVTALALRFVDRPGAFEFGPLTQARKAALAAIAATAVVVATVLVVANAGDKLDEFCSGNADLSQSSTRFTLDAGSNRCELWRSALKATGEDPVFGLGGGGFQFFYTADRQEPEQLARDAHNVWLEMLSEFGVVGLLLFAALVYGLFAGAVRARRLGPVAGQLACAALAAGAYWLTHSSIDWFWPYPGLTAPVIALLGTAAAPAVMVPKSRRMTGRPFVVVGMVVLAVSVVPPFLSDRLVDRALNSFRASTEQAYDDLDLARKLNPLTEAPALTEGAVARALGDRDRAIEAFREAARKRPGDYTPRYFLALLYAGDDPAAARTELAVLEELNPLYEPIEELRERIEAAEGTAPRGQTP